MTLVLQIVVLLVILIGLITIIMSIKNWHWAQMLLVLGIFFMALATFILGMEVFRIHRNIRKAIPGLEQRIADLESENDALVRGTRDAAVISRVFQGEVFGGEAPFDQEAEGRMPGMEYWVKQFQALARSRGRVWRDAAPGAVDQKTGRLAVAVPNPKPHGLAVGAIVYAFEQGLPNPAAPDKGAQYIGEFKVVEANEQGVFLEPVQRLDAFTGKRLLTSLQQKKPWSLYELLPADAHDLFAGMTEEQLKALLPAGAVNEYLRHGTPALPDDDDYHRAGFDEAGQQVGPDDKAKAVTWRYDRPLRDYSYLFPELQRERVLMLADIAGLKEDIASLVAALESANELKTYRTAEIADLKEDQKHMERDLAFITKLLATINGQTANAKGQVDALLKQNAEKAQQLISEQLAALQAIDQASPAPQRNSLLQRIE